MAGGCWGLRLKLALLLLKLWLGPLAQLLVLLVLWWWVLEPPLQLMVLL